MIFFIPPRSATTPQKGNLIRNTFEMFLKLSILFLKKFDIKTKAIPLSEGCQLTD
jgi:hypothetical protein